ncbi:uncharacterized protein LOC112346616 [Selaginella moellendorffii]|uniref:uncharacterized protein LOC112346616 n=1 Tax=Selaginella moellendorffii TaxID=88036 RepID=UPI000D1D11C1|nr:uncharacterized protein LOC112346616 [Selaginella moellendorffii]|eukprot:XP_024531751.1 uncharacterized protein LOC112346616 [Selaginella moellendorffii]
MEAQVVAFHDKPQELQCVGSMQVQRTLNHSGDDSQAAGLSFICGSLPVPTASPPKAFSSTAVVYHKRVIAPHYKLLPAETDLNAPLSNRALAAVNESSGNICETTSKTVAQKCDALAASALSGHGDGIDVIAPVDILKQIFKTPYSKARVSVAVHRIGRTLILNSGPDEDRETLVRKKKAVKLGEKLLYSRFVHHSMQSRSPPPSESTKETDSSTESLFSPWQETIDEEGCEGNLCATMRLPVQHNGKLSRGRQAEVELGDDDDEDDDAEYSEEDGVRQKKTSDDFLRVLYWQFQNLRMLLGSDLLVFSNEKHVAVSLHLMEIKRQVTPLMWLDAWLDNVMASVPELAICYHHNGVVQGYELLKTDDIFCLKGLAEDGTVFFQPHIVQQNAISVLRFLQENCKHDPGTYWLCKNHGEDVLQLYDLSDISKSCKKVDSHSTLPSRNANGNCYTLPLAMLLYRIAYSLSRSQESSDICKCAKLFRKCLEFLDNEEHLIIRAIAHEQVARLILNCCKEHDSSAKPVLLLEAYDHEEIVDPDLDGKSVCIEELSTTSGETEVSEKELTLYDSPVQVMDAEVDPVSPRLAAVHHVSEAILSLRSQRQLQDIDKEKLRVTNIKQFPLCLCGDIDCISFYDIGSSEFGVLMDQKLRELILMLGESYLALGEAYSEKGDLVRTVKAAQLACSVYASVLKLENLPSPYGCQYCLPASSSKKKFLPRKSGTQQNDLQKGLFWGQVWRLIGDVYIKNLMVLGENSLPRKGMKGGEELQMAEEIVREVKRLRKKSGQKPGCGVCSASDCSCHMDRISSGSSATSSSDYSEKNSSRQRTKHKKSGKAVATVYEAKDGTVEEESKTQADYSYKQVCKNHVCFHLQRVLTKDLKLNFVAAVDCYDAAIYALTDVPGASRDLDAAVRKKGWACNELARLILASEDLALAEMAYLTAIRAFETVGDSTNVLLVNCNLGHALRSAAEKLVAWMSVGDLSPEKRERVAREAREFYLKALKCYRAAKREAANLSGSKELEENVVTQLANTYLRLGLFTVDQQTSAVLNSGDSLTSYKLQSLFATSDILEALLLYESIPRAQETAFTHFQIGSHLRNCLQIAKLKTDYSKDTNLKFHASLADHHLRKALGYYRPHSHPTMFLDILLVECDLCFLVLPFSGANQLLILEQGMACMLEGRRALEVTVESRPADETLEKFIAQLQTLLKNLLGAVIKEDKASSARALDVETIKTMYRIALRSSIHALPNELKELHDLWQRL